MAWDGLMKILFIASVIISGLYQILKTKTGKTEKELANDYFPVQSDSEKALDHPIVGAS